MDAHSIDQGPSKQRDPGFVRRIFGRISPRYDLANHILSLGMDGLWRRRAAAIVRAACASRILDVATGSGDLALALAHPGATITGVDFCEPMLELARAKGVPNLVQGDALALPFEESSFDAVTVAFGLRNMASWEGGLSEMRRVLVPGGLLLVMDFSLPTFAPLRGLYRLYLHHVLPSLAGALTGCREAYDYLGESVEGFPRGDALRDLVDRCGFRDIGSRPLALGVAAITTARREG